MIPVATILLLPLSFANPDWILAEGQCLQKTEFPILAEVLHSGDNWPYGICSGGAGFLIPDLRNVPFIRKDEAGGMNGSAFYIKVR